MKEEHQGKSEKDGKRDEHRARYTSEDLHRALFDVTPEHRTLEELTDGIRQLVKSRKVRS